MAGAEEVTEPGPGIDIRHGMTGNGGREEDEMAVSRTYGRLSIPAVDEDEPVFILRAGDLLAQMAIEAYQVLAEAHGCQVAQATAAEIRSFRGWPGERRLPGWPAPFGAEETRRRPVASRRR